eukprot:s1657_g15.t1
MVFVNNRLVSSWSRTQKSIALSSCESEYLSAVGGGSEALYVSHLWTFLTRRTVEAKIVTDSSSCRAFSQRQGVGRLKHVDTKFLWLQQKIKEGDLEMDGVATVLNISDLGTKKLPKIRRCFLMHLLGLVEHDPSVKKYVTVGEEEFTAYMQKKNMGQSMKTVRRVVLDTLSTGADEISASVSKPLVKALTILSLQPLAAGSRMGDEIWTSPPSCLCMP